MNDGAPKLVKVTWIDSSCDAAWNPLDTVLREAASEWDRNHYTVGHLIADEKNYVVVASSLTDEAEAMKPMVADVMRIPRVAVRKIEELQPTEVTKT